GQSAGKESESGRVRGWRSRRIRSLDQKVAQEREVHAFGFLRVAVVFASVESQSVRDSGSHCWFGGGRDERDESLSRLRFGRHHRRIRLRVSFGSRVLCSDLGAWSLRGARRGKEDTGFAGDCRRRSHLQKLRCEVIIQAARKSRDGFRHEGWW